MYVSNKTPNNVSMERHQNVSVVRVHDVLLERRNNVSSWRNNNVPSVRLHDVSNKRQIKHPITSQWYISKTSQWYVSTTFHYYVSTMSSVGRKWSTQERHCAKSPPHLRDTLLQRLVSRSLLRFQIKSHLTIKSNNKFF